MKRAVSILLALLCLMPMFTFAAADSSAYCDQCGAWLSRENDSYHKPTVYSSDRSYNWDTETARDVKGITGKQISYSLSEPFDYGIYWKFTPSGVDNGFHITAIDLVVTCPYGDVCQQDHMDVDIVCKSGTFWSWEFYDLVYSYIHMTDVHETKKGVNFSGTYTIDVYMNGKWVGQMYQKIK